MGGAPISLANVILGLKPSGAEIKVLCAHQSMKSFFTESTGIQVGDIYNPCLFLGRILIGYANLLNVKAFLRTLQELVLLPSSILRQYEDLKREMPDLVHLNSSILFTTAVAAKMARIPLVWHVREALLGGPRNVRRLLSGWFIKSVADKVVAISPYCAKRLGKDKKGKVSVVYNFVDFSSFSPYKYDYHDERRKLGINEAEKLIVSLGGVSFRKGTVELVDSMLNTAEGVRLVVAGQPLMNSGKCFTRAILIIIMLFLEDLMVASGLKKVYSWYYNERVRKSFEKIPQGRVAFIGYIKDVAGLIAACDLLVFAGTTPHFPRPIYEAWAMKKPIAAFDMGGVSDEIEDGVDGVIVKERTGKMLASVVSALLNSPERLYSMSEKGYMKSVERFDLKKNVTRLMEIYRELAKTNIL